MSDKKPFPGIEIPPGYQIRILTRPCDLCGKKVACEYDEPGDYERTTKRIERIAEAARAAREALRGRDGPVEAYPESDGDLGVVDPLTQPDPETAERDQHRRDRGEHFQHASSGQQERHEARGHEDFVPVVQRKLVQRGLHRLGSWLVEVASR